VPVPASRPVTAAPPRETFFLPAARGQRLCVHYPPSTAVAAQGRIVYVHPFAEEMNKARRMVALQAEAMASAGYSVLLIDLLGCGDSSGDFADASWEAWCDDVLHACDWSAGHASGPLWLWGLRAGCLLARQVAESLPTPCNLLFWQAPASGKILLQQFLRLKLAGEMLDGAAKGGMELLRQQLAEGMTVEIAGYALAPALARGLEAAQLNPPPLAQRLEWLELATRADATLTPVAGKTLAAWQQAGWQARARLVTGPSFWQTTEIEDAPALITASLAALADGGTSP